MSNPHSQEFDTAGPKILEAIRAGFSLDAAARHAGVPVGTARGWVTRGRKDPDGRYGSWATSLDAARNAHVGDDNDTSRMTHAEIERRLTALIRRDNLAAMRAWLDLHPRGEQLPQDELSWIEEGTISPSGEEG